MTDTPAPAITLDSALAAFHAEMATLSPDEQTRLNYAISDLLPLLLELAEGAEHPWFQKVPVIGKMIESGVDAAEAGEERTILAMLVPPTPATPAAA